MTPAKMAKESTLGDSDSWNRCNPRNVSGLWITKNDDVAHRDQDRDLLFRVRRRGESDADGDHREADADLRVIGQAHHDGAEENVRGGEPEDLEELERHAHQATP